MKKQFDRRRKYYMILDCETATLPFVKEPQFENARDKIAISKPLIYDLGYQIIDIKGKVYKRVSFLITEIFSTPSIFNTAYYASKRPIYIEKLNNNSIEMKDWESVISIFETDLQEVCAVGAYNSAFDFKKAIPFTDLYITQLYSNNYFEWEQLQYESCLRIAKMEKFSSPRYSNKNVFSFHEKDYPLFDLWGLSCNNLINNDDYRTTCIKNEWTSKSGKYFPTNAEKVFAYMTKDYTFSENHTAIEDAEIESYIFSLITKKTKHNFNYGIEYFPFRAIGLVKDYI